jgi:hypothetical protein
MTKYKNQGNSSKYYTSHLDLAIYHLNIQVPKHKRQMGAGIENRQTTRAYDFHSRFTWLIAFAFSLITLLQFLHIHQSFIKTIQCHQLFVRTAFGNFAFLQYDDLTGMAYGR